MPARPTTPTTTPPTGPRRRRRGRALALVAGLAALAAAPVASAAVASKTLCVYDPGGQTGDLFAKAQKYGVKAAQWGVHFTLKAYTNESIAAADFRNKKCDAALLTGVTGKEFNRKTYTLEALGLFDTYDKLQAAVQKLATPTYAFLSVSDVGGVKYETAGVYPGGAVYLFLRDRGRASLSALAGAQIATIAGDDAASTMVDKVGAIAKRADISTFASMFNNGGVDVCYAPATAYGPMELRRGIGDKGGIVRFPIAQLTFQVFIRPDEFPAGFAQSSRAFVADNFTAMRRVIEAEESNAGPWIDVAAADQEKYRALLAGVREALKQRGTYEAAILTLFK